MRKLYCYVDEAGQDPTSEFFIVVAVVSDGDQERLRDELSTVEYISRTVKRKWHTSRPEYRMKYLTTGMDKKIAAGDVYFGQYPKPVPYFFPMIEVLEKAITKKVSGEYRAVVFIDGNDKKKARALTTMLRIRGVKLEMVRSRRDESEPIIRLADMWAGCIRAALLGKEDEMELVERARRMHYIVQVETGKTP